MRVAIAIGAAALLAAWAPPSNSTGEVPEIFTAIQLDPPVSPPGQYLGTYTVSLDLEAILQPAQALTLNLPGHNPETVELKHWEPRNGYIQIPDPNDPTGLSTITIPDPSAAPEDFSWRWYGKSDNYTVALTLVDGVVAGRITSAANRYAIEPRADNLTRLGLVNSDHWQTHPGDASGGKAARAPAYLAPGVTDTTSDNRAPDTEVPAATRLVSPKGSGWDPACSGAVAGGTQVIDVLLFYTEGLLARYGGNVTMVRAVLQTALDDANQALRNSGIQGVTFSPRGPELLPNETTGPGFDYDEQSIVLALFRAAGVTRVEGPPYYTFPGNAYVAGRRNTQWADIVAVGRNDQSGESSCGVSFANRVVVNNDYPTEPGPDFERFAYMVFDPACNADRLNLAHELGHQMGMEHDPTNFDAWSVPGIDPSCPWSFGHKRSFGDARFRFRTVMAYWQNAYGGTGGPPSCGSSTNCPQIDAFSTPLLEWAGDPAGGGLPPFGLQPVGTVAGASPIGVAVPTSSQKRANAADTIKRIAPIVEDYRGRPDLIFANGFQ